MADDYLVKLGIDGNNLLKGLDDTIKKLENTEKAASDTGKEIEQAFDKANKASETLDKNIKKPVKELEILQKTSKMTGDALSSGLSVKGAAEKFKADIDNLKKNLDDFKNKNKIGIDVDTNAAKNIKEATDFLKKNYDEIKTTLNQSVEALNQNINESKAGIEAMTADLKDLENVLDNLAPSAGKLELIAEFEAASRALNEEKVALADYKSQLKETEEANKNLTKTLTDATAATDLLNEKQITLNSSFDEVYGDVQPLTTRLGELEDRMYEMALAGQQNTQEFKELQAEAIKYRQTIQQVDAAVDTFAKNSAILDITIEAAQGLTGAFAAVQGASALFGEESEDVQKALLKVNAAMSILQGLQAVSAVLNKQSAVSALLLRNNLVAQATATDAVAVAERNRTVATKAGTIATKAAGVALKALGIGLIISLIAYLVSNWDKLTDAVNKFLPAGQSVGKLFDEIKSYAVGVGNAVVQFLISPFKALTALLSGDMETFKKAITDGFSFKANFTKGFHEQELRNEKAHQKKLEEERINADARDLERRKNRGENVEKEEIALQKRRLALQEKNTKEWKEANEELENLQDSAYKADKDKREARAKEMAQKSKEQRQKELEEEKKANDQRIDLARQLENARIAEMQEGLEKEKAEIENTYKVRIEDLKKQEALSTEAQKQLADLELALITEKNEKIKQAEEKAERERATLLLASRQTLNQLQRDSEQRSLEALEIDHEQRLNQIEEQYKNEETLRKNLILALEESTERERKNIRKQYAENALKEEEEMAILSVEMMSKYAVENEKTEQQKQLAILAIKLDFAQKNLQLLEATGSDENKLQIAQAKKLIQDLRNEIDKESKNGKGFDFFEFIGLGDLSTEQKNAVMDAARELYEGIKDITDAIISQYDRQIDKKQETIDQIDEEIGELEDSLDREKELRDQGFANNVEAIEAEIAEKERQKQEEIRQQEELLEQRKKMQKAQLAIDTAMQLTNLITASTNIFNALSSIPFVGIPLAIATIGVMFGAFAVTKAKAAQSINDQKLEKGGWIKGKRHSEGGVKIGLGYEAEDGEFVTNRKTASKYPNFLEAMNENKLSSFDIGSQELGMLLSELGIDLSSPETIEAVQEQKTIDLKLPENGSNDDFTEMNGNLRFLAEREKMKENHWEDTYFYYRRRGNRTTKIRK